MASATNIENPTFQYPSTPTFERVAELDGLPPMALSVDDGLVVPVVAVEEGVAVAVDEPDVELADDEGESEEVRVAEPPEPGSPKPAIILR